MPSVAAMLMLASALLGLVACADPLAPGDYRGEVIFRAQGVVEGPASGESWHELRPVLALISDTQLQLVDSISVRPRDASGISGDFNLELYDVPPDETMNEFEEHPEWGRIAMGMIAAVRAGHAERNHGGKHGRAEQQLPVLPDSLVERCGRARRRAW